MHSRMEHAEEVVIVRTEAIGRLVRLDNIRQPDEQAVLRHHSGAECSIVMSLVDSEFDTGSAMKPPSIPETLYRFVLRKCFTCFSTWKGSA